MMWIFLDDRSSSVGIFLSIFWILIFFNFSFVEIFVKSDFLTFSFFPIFWPHLDFFALVNLESENFSNQVWMFLLQMMNNDLSIFEVTKTEFAFQRALIPSSKFSQIFFRQLIWRNFSICIHHAHNWWITLQYGSHCNMDHTRWITLQCIAQTTKKIEFYGVWNEVETIYKSMVTRACDASKRSPRNLWEGFEIILRLYQF